MTMADTVAVMNEGRIEQLGSPVDLYENPMTAFVANFLGQSNMVDGEVVDRAGDDVVVDVSGQRLAIPRSRVHTDASSVHVGVRPEKVTIVSSADADAVPAGHNRMVGVIEDVSFMGVSTEYTVTLPWGGGFGVFAQNLRRDNRLVPAAEVTVHWAPEHTFALDPAEPVDAGIDPDARPPGAVRQALR